MVGCMYWLYVCWLVVCIGHVVCIDVARACIDAQEKKTKAAVMIQRIARGVRARRRTEHQRRCTFNSTLLSLYAERYRVDHEDLLAALDHQEDEVGMQATQASAIGDSTRGWVTQHNAAQAAVPGAKAAEVQRQHKAAQTAVPGANETQGTQTAVSGVTETQTAVSGANEHSIAVHCSTDEEQMVEQEQERMAEEMQTVEYLDRLTRSTSPTLRSLLKSAHPTHPPQFPHLHHHHPPNSLIQKHHRSAPLLDHTRPMDRPSDLRTMHH
jgi:hypothetical protein